MGGTYAARHERCEALPAAVIDRLGHVESTKPVIDTFLDHLLARLVSERDPIGLQFVSTIKENNTVATARTDRTHDYRHGRVFDFFVQAPGTRHGDAEATDKGDGR